MGFWEQGSLYVTRYEIGCVCLVLARYLFIGQVICGESSNITISHIIHFVVTHSPERLECFCPTFSRK